MTSKVKLNLEFGWESINDRGDILSLSLFHKIHLGETRPLIKKCMPEVNLGKSQTRANIGYISQKYRGANYEKSFFPNTLKIWNNLPKNIQSKNLIDFKYEIKRRIKPPRYKHFGKGTKLGNSLLTKIRVGRSNLNQHQFTVGLLDSPHRATSPLYFQISGHSRRVVKIKT